MQTIVVLNVVVVQVAQVHVPNVSVTAIEVVRRQGPPNARTQAQKCLLTTQHSSYYKSIHIVIARIIIFLNRFFSYILAKVKINNITSACLSQTSKTHVHHNTLEKSKAFPLLKTCRLSRVYTRKRR